MQKMVVFDVEGTLYKGGKLRPNVVEMMMNLTNAGVQIALVSGMNMTELKAVQKKIDVRCLANSGKHFLPILASNGGAYIVNLGDKTKPYRSAALLPYAVQKLVALAHTESGSSIVVCRTTEANYGERVLDAESVTEKAKKGTTSIIKSLLQLLKKVELDYEKLKRDDFNNLHKKPIRSIEIIALPSSAKRIYKAIMADDELNKYAISPGASIQITPQDKWKSVLDIAKAENISVDDIVYVGDGINDIPCFKQAKRSLVAYSKKDKVFSTLEKVQNESNKQDCYATENYGSDTVLKYLLGAPLSVADREKLQDETYKIMSKYAKSNDAEMIMDSGK